MSEWEELRDMATTSPGIAASEIQALRAANSRLLAVCKLALDLLDCVEVESLRLRGHKAVVRQLKAAKEAGQ